MPNYKRCVQKGFKFLTLRGGGEGKGACYPFSLAPTRTPMTTPIFGCAVFFFKLEISYTAYTPTYSSSAVYYEWLTQLQILKEARSCNLMVIMLT